MTVLGAVERPGVYVAASVTTVSEVIALAGGIAENGSIRNIMLKHRDGTSKKVDLFEFFETGTADLNPTVDSGDTVQVPVRYATVRADGQVKRPGLYEIVEGESLADLIGFAKGFTTTAILEKAEYRSVSSTAGASASHVVKYLDFREGPAPAEGILLRDSDEFMVYDIAEQLYGTVRVDGAVRFRQSSAASSFNRRTGECVSQVTGSSPALARPAASRPTGVPGGRPALASVPCFHEPRGAR